MRSCAALLALGTGLLLLAGCGGPALAPVKGRVTCNNKPVAEAAITFSPIPKSEGEREAGKPATGFTDADGYYVLSTYRNEDGALIGPHRVMVMLDDTNPARCKRSTLRNLEVTPGSNQLDIELNK
jgi:hypothetical protein